MVTQTRLLICLACMVGLNAGCARTGKTQTGLDRITEFKHLFEGKRVGIIANQTAVNAAGQSIVDL
ncbi:MAG: hypothetical protein GY809_09845, partial [Planctomycetes bacterium]|nr:hypothetical protein [Planctomycetota bacterium]